MLRLLIATSLLAVVLLHAPIDDAPPGRIYLPLVQRESSAPVVLISALLYDGYLSGEPDEAFQVYNPGATPVDLAGWQVASGTRKVTFPPELTLPPKSTLWCSRDATAFRRSFGYAPGCEYGKDSDPTVPNLTGVALQFANSGGRIALADATGKQVDVLAYKGGDVSGPGWQGTAVAPYHPTSSFAEAGQVLYRKLDLLTALTSGDTDSSADWAQDPSDTLRGAKVRYPGWSLERFSLPIRATQAASLQVIVAPDHSFDALSQWLAGATSSVRFEGYTFESAELAEILVDRAQHDVEVTLLLEGGPPGGVTDQQRWCVQQIERAGGRVYYLRADGSGIRERYLYQHAKFWLLDEKTALFGSENPSPDSFPADDKADGTLGRRGVYLVTDAPAVVARLQAILADDLDAATHGDIWRWQGDDAKLGAPPADFTPLRADVGRGYSLRVPRALTVQGTMPFEVVQAPEAALREGDGLLGLLARAGAGDTIRVQQLDEQTYWGPSGGNVVDNPNPRLEAYLAAARRGATVRILLDAFFDNQNLDDPRSNLRTVEYLTSVAAQEGLDLQARRGNPTGLGLHNKMVLADIGGQGWLMVGSLNGGEVSTKLNREVALIVGSDAAHDYLAEMFRGDWTASATAFR